MLLKWYDKNYVTVSWQNKKETKFLNYLWTVKPAWKEIISHNSYLNAIKKFEKLKENFAVYNLAFCVLQRISCMSFKLSSKASLNLVADVLGSSTKAEMPKLIL